MSDRTAVLLDKNDVVVAAYAMDDDCHETDLVAAAMDFLCGDDALRAGDRVLIVPGTGIHVGRKLIVTVRAGELAGQLSMLGGAA